MKLLAHDTVLGQSLRSDLTSPEAFEALVREHQGMVFRALTRLTGTGPHVEDLAQEAFLRLYRALPHFRGDSTMSTYLYRIVLNLAQDEWKRRRKEREHIAPEPAFDDEADSASWIENLPGDANTGEHARTPEQRMLDAHVQQSVDTALQQLPEMERAVLILYHQEECSYEGIAVALELPINTVRTHLHRGRKRLAELVQDKIGASRPTAAPRQTVAAGAASAEDKGRPLMRSAFNALRAGIR